MKKKWLKSIIFVCFCFATLGMLATCTQLKGEQGIQGEAGKDGVTPIIEISEDGYWVINHIKTDTKALGNNGDAGRGIENVYYDENGDLVIVYTDKTEQTVTMPVHNHVAGDWIVDTEETCEAQGMRHQECVQCHAVVKVELIASRGGHVYEQGICVTCGELKTQGLEYTLLSDDTYAVSGMGTCEDDKIYIPEYYDNKPVTRIENNAFSKTNISLLILPDSIVSIGEGAFFKCNNLQRVQLNSGLKIIESSAFEYAGVESIVIPASVETIKTFAFSSCSLLETVSVQDDSKLSAISNFLFMNCTTLKSLNFGENNCITSIGNSSFAGCSSLAIIEIPQAVTYIDYAAFQGCVALYHVTLPISLRELRSHSFYGCTALATIAIPAATVSIHYNAFTGCDSLRKITVEQGNTIYNASGNCLIETQSQKLLIGCRESVLPQDDSVKEIGVWAFGECKIETITIPVSVTKIGTMAFYNCTELKEIHYTGTLLQWAQLERENARIPAACTVICSDGVFLENPASNV